jgi:hypothetical protein
MEIPTVSGGSGWGSVSLLQRRLGAVLGSQLSPAFVAFVAEFLIRINAEKTWALT